MTNPAVRKLPLRLAFLSLASFAHIITINAQDSISIHQLLVKIEQQQLQPDPFFLPNVFPSFVSNQKKYREKRKDNNVFFTALISFTLQTLRSQLSPGDQRIADSITARSERAMSSFKNKNGRETYNFWRTDSAYRLPYLWALRYSGKNLLDDDPDCTSICLLSQKNPMPASKAHEIMQQYANNRARRTNTTFARYRDFGAYSTWLGKKLPVVFDICVLSNVLSMVQTYDLKWTDADSASLSLIVATITNNDHVSAPDIVAPYYGSTSVILYHVARLMSIKPIPELERIKDQLIDDALAILKTTNSEFEKIILANALLKWNVEIACSDIRVSEIEKNDHPFFIGNIPSVFSFPFKKSWTEKKLGFYYHYCPAYNNTLLLEWMILTNTRDATNPGLASRR